MDITSRFILFQLMIIVPFLAGIAAKRIIHFNDPARFTKQLIRVNLVVIEPVIVLWSTWGLTLTRDLIMLPLAGLFLVSAGMVFGGAMRRVLGVTGKKGATFLISSSLANHGFTMGAFLCFLLLGERGLGLAFIFLAYFMPYVFLVIFPYAGSLAGRRPYDLAFARDFFLNLQNMPLYAIIVSLVLLSVGLVRPQVFFPVDAFIMVSMALYYFTLGINFQVPAFFTSGKENGALAAVKFLLVPAVTIIALTVLHLDPAVEMVILIQSFMPAAIYSVVASVLYDLDSALASNMFVWNTVVFLAGVLPVLFIFRRMFFALIQ